MGRLRQRGLKTWSLTRRTRAGDAGQVAELAHDDGQVARGQRQRAAVDDAADLGQQRVPEVARRARR